MIREIFQRIARFIFTRIGSRADEISREESADDATATGRMLPGETSREMEPVGTTVPAPRSLSEIPGEQVAWELEISETESTVTGTEQVSLEMAGTEGIRPGADLPGPSGQSEISGGNEQPFPGVMESEGVDLGRWMVTLHNESPFEKVGRIYISGESLVIRSDIDLRGFSMRLSDVDEILEGEIGQVYLLDALTAVGTAKLSVSGKGMNFTIAPFFYTTPLTSLVRVLQREVQKAPLFVGRDQVEP